MASKGPALGVDLGLDEYDGFLDWFVSLRVPWAANGQLWWEPTFLSNELEFYLVALCVGLHAWRHGSRYVWLAAAICCHGITVELASYWLEPIDSFWHAQSTLMFFGKREPLQIFIVYVNYLYICAVAVKRLRVPELCEGPTLALLVIVLDVPYDVMGIKLLWWTWHETDANIRDRNYWVPWTSYLFHMTFACSFALIYNAARRRFVGLSGTYSSDEVRRMPFAQQRAAGNVGGEALAMACAGLFSMPLGCVQFAPTYHLATDVFGLHAEIPVLMVSAVYLTIAVYGLLHRRPANEREAGERLHAQGSRRFGRGRWHYDEILLGVLIHFGHYMALVLLANPASLQVYGMHQTMGSMPGSDDGFACDTVRELTYPYPLTPSAWPSFLQADVFQDVTVWKRPFLCPPNVTDPAIALDEGTFGFDCPEARAQAWSPGNNVYWICGTDYTNKGSGTTWAEYVILVWGASLLGINVFAMFLQFPRTLFSQVFFYREFPVYYKVEDPRFLVDEVLDARVHPPSGQQQLKVRRRPSPSWRLGGWWRGPGRPEEAWVARDELVQDGSGPAYGEQGGLYGVLFDTFGNSTRDRVRTFEARRHALERIKILDNAAPAGISYDKYVPAAAVAAAAAKPTSSASSLSSSSSAEELPGGTPRRRHSARSATKLK